MLLWTIVVVIAGAAVVLIGTREPSGVVLCVLVGVLLWFRAQDLPLIAHRFAPLCGGLVLIALALYGGHRIGAFHSPDLLVLLALLVVAAGCVGAALYATGRPSPGWARVMTLVELALVVVLLPVLAWVCGLYRWFGLV